MMTEQSRKRMKKEEREQQIQEAARKVFIEKGYKGATTMEIAQEAGISEVTLFRYFSSKQELFTKSIEPILTDTLQKVMESTSDKNPKDRIKKILQDRISFISKNHQLIKMILMEDQIENELPSLEIINNIHRLLNQTVVEIQIPKEKKAILLRMMMGIVLSFLFMPESDKQIVNETIVQIVDSIRLD